MIGRFSMGKQVGTPSMLKKSGKPDKAKTTGLYSKPVVARKVSKMQPAKLKRGF